MVQHHPNDQRRRLAESARVMSFKQIDTDVQNYAWSVWGSVFKSYKKDMHYQKC